MAQNYYRLSPLVEGYMKGAAEENPVRVFLGMYEGTDGTTHATLFLQAEGSEPQNIIDLSAIEDSLESMAFVWTDQDGVHITPLPKDRWQEEVRSGFPSYGEGDPVYNILISADRIQIMSKTDELAYYGSSGVSFHTRDLDSGSDFSGMSVDGQDNEFSIIRGHNAATEATSTASIELQGQDVEENGYRITDSSIVLDVSTSDGSSVIGSSNARIQLGASIVSEDGGGTRAPSGSIYLDANSVDITADKVNISTVGKALWSGTWSVNSTKTVSGLNDYCLFAVSLSGSATQTLAYSPYGSTTLRAFGGYINTTPNIFAYAATFSRSGETLTLQQCGDINIAGTTITSHTVSAIYGIV